MELRRASGNRAPKRTGSRAEPRRGSGEWTHLPPPRLQKKWTGRWSGVVGSRDLQNYGVWDTARRGVGMVWPPQKKIAWESVAMLVGQSPPNVRGPGIIPGGGFWGRQKTSQNIRTERDHRWTFGDCWAECSSNGKVWDRAWAGT